MNKHTPGPWEVSEVDPHRVNVAAGLYLHPHETRVATKAEALDDDWFICQCDGTVIDRPKSEILANARLIAAAPELLEVCREVVAASSHANNIGEGLTRFHEATAMARKVIAKAEGGAS
jgi:hypothetical protein